MTLHLRGGSTSSQVPREIRASISSFITCRQWGSKMTWVWEVRTYTTERASANFLYESLRQEKVIDFDIGCWVHVRGTFLRAIGKLSVGSVLLPLVSSHASPVVSSTTVVLVCKSSGWELTYGANDSVALEGETDVDRWSWNDFLLILRLGNPLEQQMTQAWELEMEIHCNQ